MNKLTIKTFITILIGTLISVGVVTVACTRSASDQPPQPAIEEKVAPAPQAATAAEKKQLLEVKLQPAKAKVGNEVQATAAGLTPGSAVELIWETVTGGGGIEGYYQFKGKQYKEASQSLGKGTVGSDGRLLMKFTAPEDYGGIHNVIVSADGQKLAQGAFDLTQSFEMFPTEGPVGTPIEIRVKGLGHQKFESTWVVNWDNQIVGWVSAAGTKGSAVARFRATGPAGDHPIKVYTGWAGQTYLNFEQSSTGYLPRPDFVFRTTPGPAPKSAFAEPYVPQQVPAPEVVTPGAKLELSSKQGPVGSAVQLKGSGFAPNKPVSLVWETWVGNRIASAGYAPKQSELKAVTTGPDGSLNVPLSIPDDLGGLHSLTLKSGDEALGTVYYAIETSIVSITPASGPVGTPITIHLKGVGWTEYDNILIANYDNAYMGYACGFNSQGDVVINFVASGAPGVHLIDLYPGIYQGPPEFSHLLRLPQLTYADDHPGNKIPALRFAFEVTK